MSGESTIRVLVVDDERDIREGAARVLARDGLHAEIASGGADGIRLFSDSPFDIVLLDLKMPGIDGMEVLRRIRSLDPGAIVIVITGFATLETAVDAMKAGAYDFLAKPFTPDQLRLTVRRAKERIELRREARRLEAERRRTLRDVATEKSRSRAVIDLMDDGVLLVNRQGEVVLSNPAAAALLEVDRATAENVPFETLIDIPECREMVRTACEGGPIRRDDHPLEVCVKGRRTLTMRVQPIREGGASGSPEPRESAAPGEDGAGAACVGAVVLLSDVTAYKELDRMKSELVAKVSHEIRSPLASIHQQLATVLYEMVNGSPNEQREVVSRARDRTRGVINLVSDLLDLSRLEAGGGSRMPERLDLFDAVAAALDVVRPQADERGVAIDVRRPPEPALVDADPRDIDAVLGNLLTNAVNYTPRGGHVTVSGRTEADSVLLAVADDGVGIAADDIPRIFENFYRVKTDATRHVVGTGLGLPIVKRILADYGGSIDVASEIGKGSTFTVRFPAAPRGT